MKTIKKLDPILKISFLLMLASFFAIPFDKHFIRAIDFRVISILFSLMLVIENLKEARLFDWISEHILERFHTTRQLALVFILLSFFLSMLITNDVALLTLVPFTLLLLKDTGSAYILMDTIILETVAANLGSQFTPIGNPQNLYIYSHFNLDMAAFLRHMLPLTLLSLFLTAASSLCIKREKLQKNFKEEIMVDSRAVKLWSAAFLLCLLSVIRIFPYAYLWLLLLLLALLTKKRTLVRIDYGVLFTFVFLFIFVNNILQIKYIETSVIPILQKHVYASALIFSQFISNVPAAMLFGPLTKDWESLLYAVNVGGLGTLIASMASIISYKIYVREEEDKKLVFLGRFSLYNLVFLIILASAARAWLRI